MSEPAASPELHMATQPSGPKAGDDFESAFNALRTELVSTLYFYLGNYEDAQDAAQETFIKCWRASKTIVEVRNWKAWIFRIGLNAAKDLQRNAWRRKMRPLASATPMAGNNSSPHRIAEEREDQDRLRQAIMDLRPEEREVYLLRQNGSLTFEEIAELRKSPVGTVKTQMRSAIAKLRLVLKEK